MGFFLLFICLLGAAILLVYAASSLPPASLARIVRYVAGGILSIASVFLLLTGRLGLAAPAALAAWALFRGNLGGLGAFARHIPGVGQPSSGQSSDVETEWLEMWLDHDTGQMGGRVRQGRFAGVELEAMSLDDLLALRSELVADSESVRLLDSYLDRTYGEEMASGDTSYGEDSDSHEQAESARRSASGMTHEEALEVLGVAANATIEDIKKAHRDLMQKVHPDKGGSSYLAAKINQAKDILLARAKA